MARNSVEGQSTNYVINICDKLSHIMDKKMSDMRREAPSSGCCIYRVPDRFRLITGEEYIPGIIPIGPNYWSPWENNKNKIKWQCLHSMLSRTRAKGITLEECFKSIHPLETKARKCYSGEMIGDWCPFLETMVVDGCFILELFRTSNNPRLLKADAPPMKVPNLYGDLLLLECQIPFFVLETLFEISKMPDEEPGLSLPLLALRFFNNVLRRPNQAIERYAKELKERCDDNPENRPLHLLDLVRSSLIPMPPQKYADTQIPFIPIFSRLCKQIPFIPCFSKLCQKDDDTQIQFIPCISKLRRAGIKVRPGKADTFLAVKFEHGVIKMPTITISGFMKLLLRNCVAFEQLHKSSSKHVTVYATFLGCLVNTLEDVDYLRERDVINNDLDNDSKIALVINKLGKEVSFDMHDLEKLGKDVSFDINAAFKKYGKEVSFDIRDSYLSKLFKDVAKYYENRWHVQWASFKLTYFNTPWTFISAFAALVLLLLTIVQTFFAVYSYVHPNNGDSPTPPPPPHNN